MAIEITEYFSKFLHHPDVTDEVYANAEKLLDRVAQLENMAREDGVDLPINPVTKSRVSGQQYGGFRPHNCPEGSSKSAHKSGMAVDLYDPSGDLDDWIADPVLEECGLYREHPDATRGWCHLTIRAPGSGKRTFMP